MNIKDFTRYIIYCYNKEILESYYDSKNVRKNKVKDIDKLNYIKDEAKRIFKINELITDFKVGPSYNLSNNPWVHIHDIKNNKGTKGEYIGISFNTDTLSIEIWLGFGRTNYKKKEIAAKRDEYINVIKSFEPYLKRDFKYTFNNFDDAIIISKSIKVDDINDSMIQEDLKYLSHIYMTFENKLNDGTNNMENDLNKINDEIKIASDKKIEGKNIIYIGIPGSGKSYMVKENHLAQKYSNGSIIYNDDKTLQLIDSMKYETVVFYPEYSNEDFIGRIAAITKNNFVSYKFLPGPFTKILDRAIKNPDSNFYLIIEELNRGNASAIFGDIFLLLDRQADGRSVYAISNNLIAGYIYNNPNKKIYIPENLSIIATMSSTNENTIPIDAAFRRRWNFVWVNDEKTAKFDNLYIKGFGNITWGKFRKTINNKILQNENNEDKKLSAYFIDENYLSEKINVSSKEREKFINKVYIYLFDDAFKYNRLQIFKENIKTIDDLVKISKREKFSVFTEEIQKKLMSN